MPKSATRGIAEIVVTIGVAVVVLYLIGYVIDYLDQFSPALVPYRRYVEDAMAGVLAIGVATIVVRITKQIMDEYTLKSRKPRNLGGTYIVLRVIIYFIAIVWFLSYIGIGLEGALVGGAIGGIVIGIAVQSLVTSLFSGLMVSADGLVVPGESVSIYSYIYGRTITAEVIDVRLLHTIFRDLNGQLVRVPNTVLLNYTVFTRLRDKGLLKYVFQATVGDEVPVGVLIELAKKEGMATGKESGLRDLEIQFLSKNNGSNTLNVSIRFEGMSNLNKSVSHANLSIDKVYRELKETGKGKAGTPED